ncbi:hypothetical protein AQUCO_03500075v1 [Aquilegia coerulea]|uniref:Pentacotripeptide-repeat region of PRORP domain-containing protein n=1 Tax=Aquilegia coerulea TaxID=218851 RepID=A0A2G5CW02_AQUCA|nr:hypothetical protein AQUCO_03500075v1 [Aquilegia coerulea]
MYALRSSVRHCRFFTTTRTITTSLTHFAAKPKLHEPENVSSTGTSGDDLELIVKRLVASRRLSDVETLIQSHKKDPKITEENYFSSLIRSYVNLFDEMPERYGFSPDEVSYGIFVKSLIHLRLLDKVFPVLDEIKEKNIEITTAFYATVLFDMYKKGMVAEAEKLWKEMVKNGCSHDVALYNVRAAHLMEPGEVSKLIDEMKAKGVKPDITTYNYLSTVYFKHDMAEDAYKIYQELEKHGCVPNHATFRHFISSLSNLKEFEWALEVFKDSVSSNAVSPTETLKILVLGLAESSKRKEAKEVIRMLRDKYGPDQVRPIWNEIEVKFGLN